ncbi:hypothetical protein Poli38472_009152 [Pythium oligandrum]|uniref:RecA-like C-terminal domain-containing protein n=1 Tax=Pythium oligandrum TaxID=41045 RepID=A0A8K1CLS7_PYTOL|nr:hypothetical protein Poli38472_009152 [Pythium oligandrum]|eukprot:TMW64985.1 hypothetical protein Poli38472_009152 [Pythium oligandrum]
MSWIPLLEPIGQGKIKAKQFLEANPEIAADIEAQFHTKLFASSSSDETEESEEVAVDDNAVEEETVDKGAYARVPEDDEDIVAEAKRAGIDR